jgi:hypothetical protein
MDSGNGIIGSKVTNVEWSLPEPAQICMVVSLHEIVGVFSRGNRVTM